MNLDMTLREFFELSERMAAAARVIRESQAMLGGAQSPIANPPSNDELANAAEAEGHHGIASTLRVKHAAPVVQWSPEEQAIRARLKTEREATAKKLEEVVLESRQ